MSRPRRTRSNLITLDESKHPQLKLRLRINGGEGYYDIDWLNDYINQNYPEFISERNIKDFAFTLRVNNRSTQQVNARETLPYTCLRCEKQHAPSIKEATSIVDLLNWDGISAECIVFRFHLCNECLTAMFDKGGITDYGYLYIKYKPPTPSNQQSRTQNRQDRDRTSFHNYTNNETLGKWIKTFVL